MKTLTFSKLHYSFLLSFSALKESHLKGNHKIQSELGPNLENANNQSSDFWIQHKRLFKNQ